MQENVTLLVIKDLLDRREKGMRNYGKELLSDADDRDYLTELYEELLDAAQYLRKVLAERG